MLFSCVSNTLLGVVVAVIVCSLDLKLQKMYLCNHSVPITTDVVSSNLDQREVFNIMFVSALRQVSGFLCPPGSPVSSTNKTERHDITEILLKVTLNTIKQTNKLS